MCYISSSHDHIGIGEATGGLHALPDGHVVQGGWETDEDVESAAARETVEEAGVRGRLEVSCPESLYTAIVASCSCRMCCGEHHQEWLAK